MLPSVPRNRLHVASTGDLKIPPLSIHREAGNNQEEGAGLNGDSGIRRLRLAIYSHDTMGIGHLRRNLLIVQALTHDLPVASTLLFAGAREAGAFVMPCGADCLTLPSIGKLTNGDYSSRCLGVGLDELYDLRARTLRAAIEAYRPHLFIVDKVPRGAGHELDPALEYARRTGSIRCVLGLRDVLDDPQTVHEEWTRDANEQAIGDWYDAVWVYGDSRFYDPVAEYGFSEETASKIRFTGYFDQRQRLAYTSPESASFPPDFRVPPDRRLVLCTVGGGQDGVALAGAFAKASLPNNAFGVLLAGPFMPPAARAALRKQIAGRRNMRLLDFSTEPAAMLSHADRVIAMGGYNTISEILAFGKPALVVPRVQPRREQYIRARRLEELNLVEMLHPNDLTPDALSDWMKRDLPAVPHARELLDFGGLPRLSTLAGELVGEICESRGRCVRKAR